MRKFLLLLLLFCTSAMAAPLMRSEVLYNAQGGPSEALLAVLKAFDVSHNGSWAQIIEQTQKQWLRPEGSERWDLPIRRDLQPEQTYALFSALDMTETLYPIDQHYMYAAVHGATLAVVQERVAFLKSLWESGVRFEAIVFLTAARPLSSAESKETKAATEGEMMQEVFNEMDLPDELYKLPLIIISVPMGAKRPNTADTLRAWRSSCAYPGSVLFITSQPFIGRADSLERKEMPTTFTIETVGPGFTLERYKQEKRGTAILLDELARYLYQERCCS